MTIIADINHIALEGAFRIWFEGHYTCIWWEGLPDDVHFTLSHRPEDEYVNLHITRNIGDSGNKPKIEIARLHKDACVKMLEAFSTAYLHIGWEKVFLNLPKGRYKKSPDHYFLSLDELQKHKRFSKLRQGMSHAFQKSSRIKRKNRLKIFKTIEQEMEQLYLDPSLQKSLNKSFRKLPLFPGSKPQVGILVSEEYTGCVILTREGVFQLNRSALPGIISRLIQPELYADFLAFIPFAIQQVSHAKTYRDTEHLDHPYSLHLVYPDANIPVGNE